MMFTAASVNYDADARSIALSSLLCSSLKEKDSPCQEELI